MQRAAFKYLWNLSTAALPRGLYPDVETFAIPSLRHICSIPLDTSSLPLSDTILYGTPFSHIQCLKIAFAIVSLVLSGIGTATGHLVKWSIIVSTHIFPVIDCRNGPTISMAIVWFGYPLSAYDLIPARIGLGVFRLVHAKHALIHRTISDFIPGQ